METRVAERRPFGRLNRGDSVDSITLRNGALSASILTMGATLQGLVVPDRAGEPGDIVLGHMAMTIISCCALAGGLNPPWPPACRTRKQIKD